MERTHGKATAGVPSEVAECGVGRAKLQLADPTRYSLADPAAPHSRIEKSGGTVGERN